MRWQVAATLACLHNTASILLVLAAFELLAAPLILHSQAFPQPQKKLPRPVHVHNACHLILNARGQLLLQPYAMPCAAPQHSMQSIGDLYLLRLACIQRCQMLPGPRFTAFCAVRLHTHAQCQVCACTGLNCLWPPGRCQATHATHL